MKSVNMQLGDGNDSVEIMQVDDDLFEVKFTIDGKVNSFYLTHKELKVAEQYLMMTDN